MSELLAVILGVLAAIASGLIWGRHKYNQGSRDGRRKIVDAVNRREQEARDAAEKAEKDAPSSVDDALDRLRDRKD